MAQITLDLKHDGPALRRRDKRDSETTKKEQRKVKDDKQEEDQRGRGNCVIACVWVRLCGGAARHVEKPADAPIW